MTNKSCEEMGKMVSQIASMLDSFHISCDDALTLLLTLVADIIADSPKHFRQSLLDAYIQRLRNAIEDYDQDNYNFDFELN